jgi:hypothetical protein
VQHRLSHWTPDAQYNVHLIGAVMPNRREWWISQYGRRNMKGNE